MCDTIVVNKRFMSNRQNLLVKNSDRPLGECQVLELFPAGTKTSYQFSSPLLKGTGADPDGSRYSVLGSRPYWLYGFEMGANEKGLFIGNEAEGSRMSAEKEEGILGMDLLRFALEACETAQEAIRFIARLLKEYGQSANASRLFDRRYENSFILCDPQECWVMETAGRSWAAKEIEELAAVSNCYTIRSDFDLCSEDLEEIVRKNRWLSSEEPLDFAKAVTKPGLRQRLSVPRMNRMYDLFHELLTADLTEEKLYELHQELEQEESKSAADPKTYLNKLQKAGCCIIPPELGLILTDHFEGELSGWRFGSLAGENVSICMHANTPEEAQTAASMIMTTIEGPVMKFLWAPSSPCMSGYLPVWWISDAGPSIPDIMSRGGEFYDASSLWWVMQRLVSLVSIDEEHFGEAAEETLYAVGGNTVREINEIEKEAAGLAAEGKKEEAQALLDACTLELARELYDAAAALCEDISAHLKEAGGLYGPRKELLSEYARRVRMPL